MSARPVAFARIAGDVEAAIGLIEDAMRRPPAQLTHEVDIAERKIVDIRNTLIDVARMDAARAATAREALHSVNAALSLVAGVEYPATGIQRSMLEQARDALRRIVAEHRLTA